MDLVHQILADSFRSNSDRTAIVMNDKFVTYKELDQLSNQIANQLIQNGVGANDIVGICKRRSIEMVASMIAILKVGASYLPLDPEYPRDRLQFMVDHAKVKTILIDEDLKNIFESKTINFLNNQNADYSDIFQSSALGDVCYVIYTSGSTGKPKAVAMGHRPLFNLIKWQNKETKLKQNSITLQFTPISFDVHFQEIFSTLSLGGTLVLISEELRLNTVKMIQYLNDKKVNRLYLPFVALNHLCEVSVKNKLKPIYLKEITTAGEQLKITSNIIEFFKALPEAKLFNHYGPSETHVVTSKCLEGNPDNWPVLPSIGSEIDNCKILLLNEKMIEVSHDEVGELYLSGDVLANGYLFAEDLTNERFLTTQFGRLYKTGDLGKRINGNEIEFLGRSDSQVKIRGYRIEPGEIEVQISNIINGKKAFVKVVSDESIGQFLCAYVFKKDNLNIKDILAELKAKIPEYMIPRSFIEIDEVPMTPSGKVDYKNLPNPQLERPDLINEYIEPSEENEIILYKIWKELLKIEKIGIDDSFFDLGGNSLLAIKMLIEINNQFNSELTITAIFEARTIKNLNLKLSNTNSSDEDFSVKTNNFSNEKIAIIGMSGRFPDAFNIEQFWENLVNVKNSIKLFDKNDVNPFVSKESINNPDYVFCSAEFPEKEFFDHKFFGMTPREAEMMDPQQRKYLELCYEALETAGVAPSKIKTSIGVFAGMGNSKYNRLVNQYPEHIDSLGEFNTMLGLEKDYIATRVAYKLNLNGPALSIHTACSTSLVAIIEAVNNLRMNNCDLALAGGIAISGSPNNGHLYNEGGILTKDGTCRPYDHQATGTVFSDGAGVVVLKRLSDAERDHDNIIALISGVGINNDGAEKISFTAPGVNGQRKAILKAMADAGISADEINMIEGHGTATPVGDPIEVEALKLAFSKSTSNVQYCTLTSLKSNMGHLTAAAGVASVIKAALSIKNKIIPGTCHFNESNSHIDFLNSPFKVTSKTEEFKANKNNKRIAGVSSFGVGGTNAHIILENYESNEQNISSNNDLYKVIKFSAKTEEALNNLRDSIVTFIERNPKSLGPLSYTLDKGRADYKYREALVVNQKKVIEKELLKDHVKFKKDKRTEVVFIFPGQGCHYSLMGKELYNNNLLFRNNFEYVSSLINKHIDYNIEEIIFSEKSNELLANTKYSQPCIFLIEMSLALTMIQAGIKPKIVVGHSIGEFAAAVISGVLKLEDAIKILIKRAQLMQKLEMGKMLSAHFSIEEAKSLANKFSVDIAAINQKEAVVFSGHTHLIDSLKEYLESIGKASIELKTSHAFHSRMMMPAIKEFELEFKNISFNQPTLNIIPTSTGANKFAINSKEYWINHITEGVDFYSATLKLEDIKDSLVFEVGPRNILSNYLKKNSNLKNIVFTTLGNNSNEEAFNLYKAYAIAWSYGVNIESVNWTLTLDDQKTILAPTYPFEKNYHWLKYKNIKSNKEEIMSTSNELQLKKKLASIFENTSGIDIGENEFSTTFLELGMDSLFLTQISLQLKKELKINVGFRQLLENYDSIDALYDHVKDQLKVDLVAEKPAPAIQAQSAEVKTIAQVPIVEKNVQTQNPPQAQTQILTRPVQLNQSNSIVANNLVDLVSKQIDLMNIQLQLLAGQSIATETVTQPVSQLTIQTDNTTQITSPAKTVVENELEIPKKNIVNRGVDIKKSKDSFGAQAKITVERSSQFNENDQRKIQEFCNKYNLKTKGSKKFAQDNRINHADPRVVTGFKPESKEVVYPIVVKKSHLQTLWDVDDNQYVDMTCGFGSNFFGNGNERIKKYVLKQIEEGIELGPQHPLVAEVSKLINELTGNERTAFCNTGSEAVLGAMRLARTVTGREKIIVFSGSYHGINDEVILRGSKNLNSIPAAPGINTNAVSSMVVLDYGTDEALEYIRKNAEDVAAVLIEPVQSRRSDFHPKEFLKEVRKITLESKTCLIFDEIITGFRVHPAGAQGYFGIRADLCTYGKIVGGGMPIGVISGKTEYMDALDGGFWQYGDQSTPTVGVTYFAGTFVRHPLALAAAKGALEILKEGGVTQLENLNNKAQKFVDEINRMLKESNIPLKMDNFGSLMKPKWTKEIPSGDLFFVALRFNGVHAYDGFPWFVNLAHTDKELQFVLNAFNQSIQMMKDIGIFASDFKIDVDTSHLKASGPPVVGAKLGKDENGNPAWFIEDPAHPGEFFKVK